MTDDKIDLTEEYKAAQEVISKLGQLAARGIVDLDWIVDEAKKVARQEERELKRKKVKFSKN